MKLTELFTDFFKSEKSGGLILIFVTICSLLLSNSSFHDAYAGIWSFELGEHSVVHWINDALMTVFFLLIGLELEREIYAGELSNIRNASLPVVGAIGGMIMPACLYLLVNYGTDTQSGAGIPMATDIAFALGILSLLGNRVPASLKVFLTALAVIDDLGAIIVIAIFYTGTLAVGNLCIALGVFGLLLLLNRLKVDHIILYLAGGTVMWYFMAHSGIHATITGVLLAFALPFRDGGKKSPSYIVQHVIHRPVAFIVLPLFALANTCIVLGADWYSDLGDASSIGILVGLLLGKPLGICLFVLLGIGLKICILPGSLKLSHLFGAGILGGIGFTMSIFISLLAFGSEELVNSSKIAILVSSTLAALIGFVTLRLVLGKAKPVNEIA